MNLADYLAADDNFSDNDEDIVLSQYMKTKQSEPSLTE
jgi:hypothetical protein